MTDQGGHGGSDQGRGKKRPHPKTFGDARLGIPAGARKPERPPAETAPGRPAAAEAAPPKGPIVERRGGVGIRRHERPAPPAAPPKDASEPAPSAKVFRAPRVERPPEPPPAPELPEPVETESFAELFARSETGRPRFSPGQRVVGKIVQIGKDTAFVELGGKVEALIDVRELRDGDGNVRQVAGQTIDAYVRSLEDGVWLTLTIPKGARREALQQARESGIPVEGTVTAVNKGGLEVDLGGGQRAFCPASQASLRFVQDLSGLVGQRLQFLVAELKDRDVVLSRRGLLEREAAEKAEALRDTLVVGARLEGTVTGVRDFGAFVDLGGLEGLVPISELSHRRVANPGELLQPGQRVTVEVLRLESGKGSQTEKITLSLKALESDPWLDKGNALVPGQRLPGKVVRLQPFGAFVELFPGVDGLVHVSRLESPDGHRAVHPKDALAEGQAIWVEVEAIDRAARKIALRPISAEEAAQPAPASSGAAPRVGDVVEATVDKVESFGLFVRWPGGRGLLPAAELGTPRGADLRRSHPAGTKLKAAIIEIDAKGRLRLSKVAADQAEERAEVASYLESSGKAPGFGTLGDLLKGRKS